MGYSPSKDTRAGAEARGRWAENLAAQYLETLGFHVLGQRIQTPVGEIDLTVQRQQLLVFAEVKYRQREEDGLWAISPRQQKRIIRAAEAWLATQPSLSILDMRFDVIIVTSLGVTTHIEDAFRPEN